MATTSNRCGILKCEVIFTLFQLEPSPLNASNLEKYIEFATEHITKPALMSNLSNYQEKQRLQKTIFAEGIYYNKENDQARNTKLILYSRSLQT